MTSLSLIAIPSILMTLSVCQISGQEKPDGGIDSRPDVHFLPSADGCEKDASGECAFQCTSDEHCPKGWECTEGRCIQCHSDSECPGNEFCINGHCYPKSCGFGEMCSCDLHKSNYHYQQPDQEEIKFTLVNKTEDVVYIDIPNEGRKCAQPFILPNGCFDSECYEMGGCCCVINADSQCAGMCVDPAPDCSGCTLGPSEKWSYRVNRIYGLKKFEVVIANCEGTEQSCLRYGEPLGSGQYKVRACAGKDDWSEGAFCNIGEQVCTEADFDIPGSFGTEIVLELK